MKLKVEHVTRFEYSQPVFETTTEVRLQPAGGQDSPQQLLSYSLDVEPRTRVFDYQDFYGNTINYFSVLPPHDNLVIRAVATVETGDGDYPMDPKDSINMFDFTSQCKYIVFTPAAEAFAAEIVKDNMNLSKYDLAEKICKTINDGFQYEKGVTTVYSTVEQVLEQRKGVCQDFAHVMITVCRILGLPTRYVSGYVWGGNRDSDQEGASHAWCEVLDEENQKWVGFDPTHHTLKVNDRYIKIGHGRDYSDIPPVKGTYRGRANENLQVKVIVSAPSPDA